LAVKWAAEHPEKIQKAVAAAVASRREMTLEERMAMTEGTRRWIVENPEAHKRRQEKAAAAMKAWQIEHPDEVKTHSGELVEAARKWRAVNPQAFAENTRKMYETPKTRKNGLPYSKAEHWLRKSGVLTWDGMQVQCLTESGRERKQVDFVSPDHKIWVEVDGFFHFFELAPRKLRKPSLVYVQARDAMLNEEARHRGDVMLIRLSGNCFKTANGKMRDGWLTWFIAMLHSPVPGVWCAGALYESVPWARSGCVILKSLTPSTTFSSPTG
jgi:hypothetical protein